MQKLFWVPAGAPGGARNTLTRRTGCPPGVVGMGVGTTVTPPPLPTPPPMTFVSAEESPFDVYDEETVVMHERKQKQTFKIDTNANLPIALFVQYQVPSLQ